MDGIEVEAAYPLSEDEHFQEPNNEKRWRLSYLKVNFILTSFVSTTLYLCRTYLRTNISVESFYKYFENAPSLDEIS
jgi:hypothetical protein